MTKTANFKEISVLIGVTAGFAFLISFFIGIGVSSEVTFLTVVFFAVIIVAITFLLFANQKTQGKR